MKNQKFIVLMIETLIILILTAAQPKIFPISAASLYILLRLCIEHSFNKPKYKKYKFFILINFWIRLLFSILIVKREYYPFPDSLLYLTTKEQLKLLSDYRMNTIISAVSSLHIGYEYILILSNLISTSDIGLIIINQYFYFHSTILIIKIFEALEINKYSKLFIFYWILSPSLFIFTMFPLKDPLILWLSTLIFYLGLNILNDNKPIITAIYLLLSFIAVSFLFISRIYAGVILLFFVLSVVFLKFILAYLNNTSRDQKNRLNYFLFFVGFITLLLLINKFPRQIHFLKVQANQYLGDLNIFVLVKSLIRINFTPLIMNIVHMSPIYRWTLLDSLFSTIIYIIIYWLFIKEKNLINFRKKDLFLLTIFFTMKMMLAIVLELAYGSSSIRQRMFLLPFILTYQILLLSIVTHYRTSYIKNKDEQTRILLIVPSLKGGGAEKVAVELSNALLEKDMKMSLAIFNSDEIKYDLSDGVNLIDMKAPSVQTFLGKILNVFNRSRIIKEELKSEQYDAVIGFTPSVLYPLLMVNTNVTKVYSVRSAYHLTDLNDTIWARAKAVILKVFFNLLDVIVVQTESQKRLIIDNLELKRPDSVKVISNLYNIDKIRKMSMDPLGDTDNFKKYFVSVGRLEKVKGHRLLIEAFKNSEVWKKGYKLYIIGSGSQKEKLKDLINQLKLDEYIVIIPFQKNPYPYMKNSLAVLHSSYNEGFPNVLLESLIVGTPVISSNCQTGPQEILSDESKNLVENDAEFPVLYRRGILCTDPSVSEKRFIQDMSLSIRYCVDENPSFEIDEKFVFNFSKEEITQKWLRLLKEAMK